MSKERMTMKPEMNTCKAGLLYRSPKVHKEDNIFKIKFSRNLYLKKYINLTIKF